MLALASTHKRRFSLVTDQAACQPERRGCRCLLHRRHVAAALADEKAELITTATERESGCLLVAGQDGVFAKLWFVAKAVGEVQR
jgi:hypothetical protein